MNHLVFGTGLVGGFIAGVLIQQGFETRLIGRDKHQAAMRDGLTVSDLDNNSYSLAAPEFFRPAESLEFGIIWLTIKCTDVKTCIPQITELVSPETIIICCQNGFGSDEALRQALPNTTIINGVSGFNVAELKPAHLHRSTDGHLVIEAQQKISAIAAQLNCDLMPTKSTNNIVAERWAKLQLNLSNPVNALADVPIKTMLEQHGYRSVIAQLMRELLAVTGGLGISLPKLTPLPPSWLPTMLDTPNCVFKLLGQKMLAIAPTARTSMWWDLHKQRPTEIDFLNAVLIAKGKRLGIDCPANTAIVELVRAVEAGEQCIGFSANDLHKRVLG